MPTSWTKRIKSSTTYTERTKSVQVFIWDNMTMTWDNAIKKWQEYYDQFIRRSGVFTSWTERTKP